MVVSTSSSGRRGKHSASGHSGAGLRRRHIRVALAVLGAVGVIIGGTLAGLAATGGGGRGAAAGAAASASSATAAGAGRLSGTSPARVPVSPAAPRGARVPTSRSASPQATPAAGQLAPFGAAASSYLAGRTGTVLAAVYDIGTGRTWHLGQGAPQAEASVVKLDILETLLAEQGGGGLPASDQSLATRMIEDSDNDAATSLWYAAGGPARIGSFNAKAGLTRTVPSLCVVCQGFRWPGWGLTTSTPDDQIALLKQLVTPSSLLTSAERDYALSLMEDVTPSQRWGVSGGVPASVTVALKNGWLPLTGTGSDWQVNSVGWIRGGGRDYLLAVLSTGNPSEQYGIDTIEQLAAMVWQGMR